jgi:2-hydroxy-3-keto-5-methylthiopentenyl-1-phosphate phosphatase
MAKHTPVRSVVVDFDGTIVPQDVSEEILRASASAEWWDIDMEFRRGEIGSRECLVRQGALLRGDRDAFLDFTLARFAVDPTFPPFVRWAHHEGVHVVVASDGFGFYVEPMLAAAGVEGVRVLTNHFASANGGPPTLSFPNRHPVCVGCGTCKMNAVLTERERTGGPVAFVGEGHSDRYGALYADVVFAAKHLVEVCEADGIRYQPWSSFDDVRRGLEELTAITVRTRPDRCPGWETPT